MIASRKKLGRSPKVKSMDVLMRTQSFSIRQGRENERVPTRRVIAMEDLLDY
jgi:hypothetical protein